METKGLHDRDVLIDLESGNNIGFSEHNNGVEVNSIVGQAGTALDSTRNGLLGSKDDRDQHVNCCPSLSPAAVAKNEGTKKSEGEKKVGLLENLGGDKENKKRSKKPPRPPRPPTPSPLDAADQKFINELSELAMLKRARIERMKALKKTKNSKPASSSSSFGALIITIIFCLVILWQGFFSRHGTILSFHGSPESSVRAHDGLISIQFYRKNGSIIGPRSSISAAPSNTETVPGEARTVTE